MAAWDDAIASRLAFFRQDVPAGTPALRPFLQAVLDLLETAAARPELAAVRDVLPGLCRLAREAIAADCDDRPVNAAADRWRGCALPAGAAASVPGRVVWLAAMEAQVPDEQGVAAVMLVNDLAAVDPAFPARAWRAALSR
jgi:hypothetical protein